jgi:hypothetical protein
MVQQPSRTQIHGPRAGTLGLVRCIFLVRRPNLDVSTAALSAPTAYALLQEIQQEQTSNPEEDDIPRHKGFNGAPMSKSAHVDLLMSTNYDFTDLTLLHFSIFPSRHFLFTSLYILLTYNIASNYDITDPSLLGSEGYWWAFRPLPYHISGRLLLYRPPGG